MCVKCYWALRNVRDFIQSGIHIWMILPYTPMLKLSLCLIGHYAMKTYGRAHIDPHFLDLGTTWRWADSVTPRPLYPRGKSPRYPLDRRLGEPQSRSGRRGEENSWPYRDTNSDPSVAQPVASRYPRSYIRPWGLQKSWKRFSEQLFLLCYTIKQRWPTGGPRLDLLRPPPSHRFIFSKS
jgi:hypothetical protein